MCLFCDIAEKKIPSRAVYENQLIYAFEDIAPQAPVHLVVIPKKHISSVVDISEEHAEIIANLFENISTIAKIAEVDKGGFRVVTNCGADGGQTVDHLHFHLLGGRQMVWPPG